MTDGNQALLSPLTNEMILATTRSILNDAWLHAKTQESVALATLGLVFSPRLSVTAIGTALAQRTGHAEKHGVKQVDRLLRNDNFVLKDCERAYVRKVVANRRNIITALDWTEFALDGQSTICLNLITKHGRATPLVWITVDTFSLKDHRNHFEDELLRLFKDCLPPGQLGVVVLADRGFGDVALYQELEDELGFDYVIRFRGSILVEDVKGTRKRADQWLADSGGRELRVRRPKLTGKRCEVTTMVAVHDPRMKEPWFLASSLPGSAKALKLLYGKRFTIEETFRDQKDMRFGWGLYDTIVTQPARRDRLLFLAALAQLILTLLGAIGEEMGQDKGLKTNTVKKRTHSLFRQGREYLKGRTADIASKMRERFQYLVDSLGHTTAHYALI